MSLLDDLTRGVKNVASSASTEASRYTLKNQLKEAEQAIWSIYSQMGYRALEMLNEGQVDDPKLRELADQLPPHLDRIGALKAEIEALEAKQGQAPAEGDSEDEATPAPSDDDSSGEAEPKGEMDTIE
ncbi:MAG: hypothetical protein GF320_00670 [Armatimonadia bacterium]|nr:hypothetical protein [Armatimonadia bacterium]